MNSPLLIGCNINSLSTTNLNLLKNKDLIALNQDTLYQQAYLAAKVNDCYIMVKDIEKANDTKRAFAIYNPNDAAKKVTLNFKDIDLADSVALHDCFTKKDIGKFYGTYEVTVPKHGTKIYVAEADTRLERTRATARHILRLTGTSASTQRPPTALVATKWATSVVATATTIWSGAMCTARKVVTTNSPSAISVVRIAPSMSM